MQISIIGSGRIGLSFGAVLAKSGFTVFMTDKDPAKKQSVTTEAMAFYEPGLKDCIKENRANLEWTRYTEKILSSDFIFFCLSAPFSKKGIMDLREIFNWAKLIIESTQKEKYLIIKSTFPIGTNKQIQEMALEKKAPLVVISCPEFLRQGQALKDISSPERLVIGTRNRGAGKKLEEFYMRFSSPKKVIYTDPETAELSKLACNSFLAAKISFINEFAGLCEKVKGDPKKLQFILGTDPRIGREFLNPGLGYGGYCLPKDINLSLQEGKKRNQDMELLRSVQKVNTPLTKSFFQKIHEYYKNLKTVPLAFWGISFKKYTDDLNNSPALNLLCRLLRAGAEIHVYDPLFVKEKTFMFFDKKSYEIFQRQKLKLRRFFTGFHFKEENQMDFFRRKIISGKVLFYKNPLESLNDRKGLIIGSDWEEFQQIPLSEIKKRLSEPFLVDGRNLFSIEELKREGFSFYQKGFSFTQKEEEI